MTKDPRDARNLAEAKFTKAEQTTHQAQGIIETELQATRKKTARLRQLRLAKEAAEGVSELDKKPAGPAKKRRPSVRKV